MADIYNLALTFTGWKNSSTTFWALTSSDGCETPEGTNAVFECDVMPEVPAAEACLFGCLL